MNPPAGAIALLDASGPVIGGMNPPAGAIAPLNAYWVQVVEAATMWPQWLFALCGPEAATLR